MRLVLLCPVIVVEVETSGGTAASAAASARIATAFETFGLAGCGNSLVVEQSEYRAGRDPEKLLKLRPASYRDGIELCGLYDRFDSRAELRKNKVASRRCGGAVHCGIAGLRLHSSTDPSLSERLLYIFYYRGEVIGLDLNSVPFKDESHRSAQI